MKVKCGNCKYAQIVHAMNVDPQKMFACRMSGFSKWVGAEDYCKYGELLPSFVGIIAEGQMPEIEYFDADKPKNWRRDKSD